MNTVYKSKYFFITVLLTLQSALAFTQDIDLFQVPNGVGDRLRCNLCGDLFTAPAPKDVQDFPISTPEANSVAAIIKYQAATPFNRFANVLKGYGTPLPRSLFARLREE